MFAAVDGKHSNTTLASWMYNQNHRNSFVADEWVVYVIDMAMFDVCAAYNRDSHNETLASFSFQDRGNGTYVDFAYFAVCDTWEEIASIVDDEQIIITKWSDNNLEKSDLADQLPPPPAEPETCVHTAWTYALVDGKATYTCVACETVVTGVNANVGTEEGQLNLVRVPGMWAEANGWHAKTDGVIRRDENGVFYTTMYECGGGDGLADGALHNGNINFLKPGDGYSFFDVAGGAGNYVVIKIKATNVTGFKLALGMNNAGIDCWGNRVAWERFDGEWAVIVIDLAALKTSGYGYAGGVHIGEEGTNISIGFVPEVASRGQEINVAYVAVCDDLNEVKSIVGDEQVYITNWVDLETVTPTTLD